MNYTYGTENEKKKILLGRPTDWMGEKQKRWIVNCSLQENNSSGGGEQDDEKQEFLIHQRLGGNSSVTCNQRSYF